MDTDEFASYLRKELVLAGLDATRLDRGLEKARVESDSLTREMKKNSARGFTLLRKYLKAQEAETKKLEKTLDRMQNSPDLLALSDTPTALLISDTATMSDGMLQEYREWQSSETLSSRKIQDTGSDRQIASLQGQVGRLLAAATPSG